MTGPTGERDNRTFIKEDIKNAFEFLYNSSFRNIAILTPKIKEFLYNKFIKQKEDGKDN